ncbi:hypothetical protein [Microseira sp. BLCC-F43]|uniref:hypothetical protein n=1 Tax=Microseira sp. BLCC-F43 TaxID=3153602 RepID=UPI0035BA03E8
MKLLAIFLSTITIAVSALALPAQAETVCKVTDPTGTPLNVRDRPNGRVINTLRNGREVRIDDIASDEQGRSWAKVGSYQNGRYRVWGWVIREFISCYNR